MAETENKIKKYVSDVSLNTLVGKIKSEDAKVLTDAKKYAEEYSESLSSNYDSAGSAITAESNAKEYAKEYTDAEITNISGSLLPSVTASDNGKFLRVSNGIWTGVIIPNAEEGTFGQ